jgi:hypothetical protein
VAQARSYAREFEKLGISKDRICIKIPSTGPALNASPILLKDGIRTLGTSLFSVVQAIAASQAGTLSISPYYNCRYFFITSQVNSLTGLKFLGFTQTANSGLMSRTLLLSIPCHRESCRFNKFTNAFERRLGGSSHF